MSALKIVGVLLMVLALPLLLGAAVFSFSDDPPVDPVVQDEATTGIVLAAVGAGFLLLGVVLLLVGPRKKVAVGTVVAAPVQPPVEIKRTEMNWGGSTAPAPADHLQADLDEVNRKMGQVKVQYGMGQISNESYKLLMAQYEREKSVIEQKIIEQGR